MSRVCTTLGVALLATPLVYGLTQTTPPKTLVATGIGLLVLTALLLILGKKKVLPFCILVMLIYLHQLLFGNVLYPEIQQKFTFKTVVFVTLPLLLTIRLSTLTPRDKKEVGRGFSGQQPGRSMEEKRIHPENFLWETLGLGVAALLTYLCLNPQHVTLNLGIPQYVVRYYYLETSTILLITILLLALGTNTLYHTIRRTREKILEWEKTGWKRG